MIHKDLLLPNSTLIIGLSGGPDSVYLLHAVHALCKEKNLTLIAAHLDHEWRSSSKDDALFCQKLCASLQIPFVCKKISELNVQVKETGSQEERARQYRRAFFTQLLHEHKADFIVLGHHADDQIETFFIRLIRGTTPSGLQCMKEKDGHFIRPLLRLHKKDILSYLHKHNLAYVTDPTNNSSEYLRNRIRTKLLPILHTIDERFEHNTLRTINAIRESETVLNELISQEYQKIISQEGLDIIRLQLVSHKLQRIIVREWLCKNAPHFTLTQSFIEEVLRFFASEKGGTHTLGTWSITKKKKKATIDFNSR